MLSNHLLPTTNHQNGNVLFIILIGVALFASLAYVVMQSSKNENVNVMTEREATLTAADLFNYGQGLSRGVGRVLSTGYSEKQISFEHAMLDASYVNGNCPDNGCKVFNGNGGGMKYKPLPSGPEWVDNTWYFNHSINMAGVGKTCGDASCSDMMAIVRFENPELCIHINEQLGIENPSGSPPVVGDITPNFTVGTFTYESTLGSGATFEGKEQGCVYEDGGCTASSDNSCYAYYHVLLAR